MTNLAEHIRAQGFILNPPAAEAAIAACEAALGCTLDARWREFLLAADGALLHDEDGGIAAQWLGCGEIPDARAAVTAFLEQHFGADWPSQKTENDDGLPLFHPLWLPFYRNGSATFCLDHSRPDAPVIMLRHPDEDGDGYAALAAADNLTQWLADNETHSGLDNDNLLDMVEDLMGDYGMLDEDGEFVQTAPQFNHYDHIGFTLRSDADFGELLEQLQSQALEHTAAPNGAYYCYRDRAQDTGLALWIAVTAEGAVSSLSPYFYGRSRRRIHIHRYLPNPDNPLDGLCYAWAQQAHGDAQPQEQEEGLYPFACNLMAFDHICHSLPADTPQPLTIALTAFPHSLKLHADAAAFEAAQSGQEVQYAANAFIPTGLYTQEDNPPLPSAYFCGTVSAVELCDNPLSGDAFYHLLINTYGGSIDLVAHPDLFARQPKAGNIIEAEAWLCAAAQE